MLLSKGCPISIHVGISSGKDSVNYELAMSSAHSNYPIDLLHYTCIFPRTRTRLYSGTQVGMKWGWTGHKGYKILGNQG